MAINAVSSAASASAKPVQQAKPQTEARKKEAPVASDESAKTRQAQQQAKAPEPTKPVVNAQGQKTGQILSVKA